jgi:hypothetical protein
MTQVILVFDLNAFGLDDDELAEESEPLQGHCEVTLEYIEGDLFRVPEPTSLTPFGPYGTILDLASVIEAAPESDGTRRYIRTVTAPPVWTRIVPNVALAALEDEAVSERLDRLQELGCGWEWCAANLTIQGLRDAADTPAGREADRVVDEVVGLVSARNLSFEQAGEPPEGSARS